MKYKVKVLKNLCEAHSSEYNILVPGKVYILDILLVDNDVHYHTVKGLNFIPKRHVIIYGFNIRFIGIEVLETLIKYSPVKTYVKSKKC